MSTSVVILCGMPSEKAILTAAYPNNLVLSGTDKLNLASLVPKTCPRIVSMGLAGGLAPPLKVADIVLANSVTDGRGGVCTCDPKWNAAIMDIDIKQLPPSWADLRFRGCEWLSNGMMDLADTATQRADLYKMTGACAIDDESYYAAVFCQQHGIMFNIARSISDDWTDTLPLAARGKIMNPDGSANVAYLFQSLATEPWAQDLDLLTQVLPNYEASLASLQAFVQGVIL